MRFDETLEFSVAQTLTGATADSANTLDLGNAVVAEGPLYVCGTIIEESVDDLKMTLQTSANGSSSWRDVGAIAFGSGAAGTQRALVVPQGCDRYLKLVYSGTTMKGKVSAGMTLAVNSPQGKRLENFAAN